MRGLRTQLTWAAIAVGCYVAGIAAFLVVVFGSGLFAAITGDGNRTAMNVGTVDLVWLLASLALFAAGGYAMVRLRRFRKPSRPERSALPPQYRSPSQGSSAGETGRRDGETDWRDGDRQRALEQFVTGSASVVRCPNCGTENDPDYEFCRDCSAPLD